MRRGLALMALAAVCAGCHFRREVVNAHVRDIDTSWIEPGRTTRADVAARIGMPSAVGRAGGVRKDAFRWVMVDTREQGLEVGYVLTPTFERGVERHAEDILVRFDDRGVVTLVSRTRLVDGEVRQLEYREAKP